MNVVAHFQEKKKTNGRPHATLVQTTGALVQTTGAHKGQYCSNKCKSLGRRPTDAHKGLPYYILLLACVARCVEEGSPLWTILFT